MKPDGGKLSGEHLDPVRRNEPDEADMTRRSTQRNFAEVYDQAKRSVQESTKNLMTERRAAMMDSAIEELTVDAFDYGVRWALQREWTDQEKHHVLGE